MALKLEDGQAVNVEEANIDFARSMSDTTVDDKVAPAPPKREPAPAPKAEKAARKPAARKQAANPKVMRSAPTDAQKKRWAASGQDIMNQLSVASLAVHAATGNQAWEKDAQLYQNVSEVFGDACANLAQHSPKFAAYLESEGGAAGAYMTFAFVGTQIGLGVIDNHGATDKLPLVARGLAYKLKQVFKGFKKPGRKRGAANASAVHTTF